MVDHDRVHRFVEDFQKSVGSEKERCFETLLEELSPNIQMLAEKYHLDGHDRDDVLQEIRAILAAAAQSFRFEDKSRAKFLSYFITSVRYFMYTWLRQVEAEKHLVKKRCPICGSLSRYRMHEANYACPNRHVWEEKGKDVFSLEYEYQDGYALADVVSDDTNDFELLESRLSVEENLKKSLSLLCLPVVSVSLSDIDLKIVKLLARGDRSYEIMKDLELSPSEYSESLKKLSSVLIRGLF